MIDDVFAFHKKFGLPLGDADRLMNDDRAKEFRINFLQEELDELREALGEGDRVKAFDALLDLAYVTYGTALFLGIDPHQWHVGFRAVHSCNMRKKRVDHPEESKRDSAFDVVKPEGWVGPEATLKEVLQWYKL